MYDLGSHVLARFRNGAFQCEGSIGDVLLHEGARGSGGASVPPLWNVEGLPGVNLKGRPVSSAEPADALVTRRYWPFSCECRSLGANSPKAARPRPTWTG
jgi:hypothetical protein